MSRNVLITVCGIVMLAATLAAPYAQAQTDSGLRLLSEFNLPNSREGKFPDVVAGGDQVYITAPVNRTSAAVWSKPAGANSFPNPFLAGPAEGQPDYSPSSVALGPDGSLYVAWINQPSRTIYLRRRDPAGTWGPTRTADRGSSFPVGINVAVSSTGQIFVIWRDPDSSAKYRFSGDGGENWSARRNLSEGAVYGSPPDVSAGPNGAVGATYVAAAGGNLQIYVALWNGSNFDTRRITALGGDYSDPSISFAPDGRVYAAWRGVGESGGNIGVFYAERQADGSWPRSRLAGGKVTGTVSINADEQGNLHVSWIAEPRGGNQLFYAFKPATGNFVGPVASGDTGGIFNPRGYGSVANSVYAHVALEEFSGSSLSTRYSLFQAQAVVFGAEPALVGDAKVVGRSGDNSVQVEFRNVRGTPSEVRWRWNAAPSDETNDSAGWKPFANPLSVPVPEAILNDTSCSNSTLYTQVRNPTTGVVEQSARTVSVLVDGVVETQAFVSNPFASGRQVNLNGLAAVEGAAAGAPNYTRVPLTYINIVGDSDCTGLTTVGVGKSANAIETTYQLNEQGYSGVVNLPDLVNLKSGPVPVVLVVTDGAGNKRSFSYTMILDEQKPILNAGGAVTATPDPRADLLQNLAFSNISVTDDQYPGRGFWGVWIANAPEPVANPLSDTSLKWTAIQAPGDGTSFAINNWSLATGLTAQQLVPNEDYYLYIRFLDGAGNPSDGVITVTVATSQVTAPRNNLPLVAK